MRGLKKCLPVLMVFLAGCSPPAVREGDAPGERLRIISLGPTITRNICLLGAGERIVGVSRYCDLPEVSGRETAGDMVSVNLEQVLKLSPDLLIATDLLRPDAVERVRRMGIETVVLSEPDSFEEILAQFRFIGELMGMGEEAAGAARGFREKAAKLRESAGGGAGEKIMVQIGAQPLWVSPRNSFINDIIEFAGGVNAGPDTGGMISVEEVLKRNPDVILVADMGLGGEQKKMWENYPAVNAVKNGRVHLVDSYAFCSPSPDMFIEALETAIKILRGEAGDG